MFGKLLQPEASFWLKMHKKHLATGLHPGPQGEHRALPRRPSWILGAAEGKGGQERNKTGRWEIAPPQFPDSPLALRNENSSMNIARRSCCYCCCWGLRFCWF